MTLTNDQIARGMASQYGRIDYHALRTHARSIAAQHPEIRAAGIALAELLGVEGDTAEPFVQAFADNLVESLMHLGQAPSMGYHIDLSGLRTPSPIVVAACKDVGLSSELIPSDFRLHVSNFQVTLKRGCQTTTVWQASLAQVLYCFREWFGKLDDGPGMLRAIERNPRLSVVLDDVLAHEPIGRPETAQSLLAHNWFGNSLVRSKTWDEIGSLIEPTSADSPRPRTVIAGFDPFANE